MWNDYAARAGGWSKISPALLTTLSCKLCCLLACVEEAAGTALCTGGVVICLLLAAGSLQVDCLSLTLECPVIWCWYTCELRTLWMAVPAETGPCIHEVDSRNRTSPLAIGCSPPGSVLQLPGLKRKHATSTWQSNGPLVDGMKLTVFNVVSTHACSSRRSLSAASTTHKKKETQKMVLKA